jgi:hypothetical protein
VSTFYDVAGQRQATRLVTQKAERATSLTAKLCTQESEVEQDMSRPSDLLIQGLIDRLPKPNGLWPVAERVRWLRTAASIFDLVYKLPDDEREEIGIVFAKTEGTKRPAHAEQKKVSEAAAGQNELCRTL